LGVGFWIALFWPGGIIWKNKGSVQKHENGAKIQQPLGGWWEEGIVFGIAAERLVLV